MTLDQALRPVIAIDGPAASGKSSTALAVATQLNLVHIESGALYRTATWIALSEGVSGGEAVAAAARDARVELKRHGTGMAITVAGESVEPQIRSAEVTAKVSEMSAMRPVRAWVDSLLHGAVAGWGGGVMDGRDIGTVVFPDAALKVFLTATAEARATRRLRQGGVEPETGAVAAEAKRLTHRDLLDSQRAVAPLRQAPDALLLDTTELEFKDQVGQILEWARARGLSAS